MHGYVPAHDRLGVALSVEDIAASEMYSQSCLKHVGAGIQAVSPQRVPVVPSAAVSVTSSYRLRSSTRWLGRVPDHPLTALLRLAADSAGGGRGDPSVRRGDADERG